jgi:hypothetical protein
MEYLRKMFGRSHYQQAPAVDIDEIEGQYEWSDGDTKFNVRLKKKCDGDYNVISSGNIIATFRNTSIANVHILTILPNDEIRLHRVIKLNKGKFVYQYYSALSCIGLMKLKE